MEEKRKLGLRIEERKNIQFHIAHVEGLPHQVGWQPRANVFVSVESGPQSSASTETRKISSGTTVWADNMRILSMTDSSDVKFEVKHKAMWNKHPSVLGQTKIYHLKELLEMQKQAGDTINASIDLMVNLSPSRSQPSPRTPKTPRSSHARTPSSASFFSVLSAPNSPAKSILPLTPDPPNSPSGKTAILRLSIRETAVADRNTRDTASLLEAFAEQCRKDSLKELMATTEAMTFLRDAFEEENNYITLIDIVLGTLEGVRKLLANSDTKNANRNTVATMQALSGAFVPYKALSARKLAKKGESSTAFMQEMLCSVVKALGWVEAFLGVKNEPLVKDKLEFKVLAWMRYFQHCAPYLNGESEQRPEQPSGRTSRRVNCPNVMVANPELPQHNMLTMHLPETHATEGYSRSDVVRVLAEWVFTSSFQTQQTVPLPTSVPQKRRPAPLNLDNEASLMPEAKRESSDLTKALSNIFCLHGPAQSGKTELAARTSEWLAKLGCLGGYFSFDSRQASRTNMDSVAETSSRQILDALPMTLIHQACTVEPDLAATLRNVFNLRPSAVHDTLEKRFEVLFTEPVKAHVNDRAEAVWNPVEPLVFVIDGVGVSAFEGPEKDQEAMSTAQMFVEWVSSKALRRLPGHIRFLVITRSETGVAQTLRERGAAAFELGPVARHTEESNVGCRGALYGSDAMDHENERIGSAFQANGGGPGLMAPAPPSNFRVSIQAF